MHVERQQDVTPAVLEVMARMRDPTRTFARSHHRSAPEWRKRTVADGVSSRPSPERTSER